MLHFLNDESYLVNQLKLRDEAALSYAYDRYAAALKGAIVHILQSEVLAEEILQDVFLKIWENVDQYDVQKGRFFTWMLRIARNTALDYLKTRQFRTEKKTDALVGKEYELEKAGSSSIAVDAIGVGDLLKDLDERESNVIRLLYLRGYTQSEASKELGMPLGTVKTSVRNAMSKLRSKLNLI